MAIKNLSPDATEPGHIEPTNPEQVIPQEASDRLLTLTVALKLNVNLLRKQKHALVGITGGTAVTSEQEDAAEGMLNLLDFLQDSILEKGLATEEEIFPRPPQLFD